MNLSVTKTDDLTERLRAAGAAHARRRPGRAEGRQPVHTVFVAADRFSRTTAPDLGTEALRLLNKHTPGDGSFGATFMLDPSLAGVIRARVAAKLQKDPVEDLRIDFADGYGARSDAEEDSDIVQVVEAVAGAYQAQQLPHFWGIRVKSLASAARSFRTIDGFLTSLRDRLGRLPGGFVITIPEVLGPDQVMIFADYLDRLETSLGLPPKTLHCELQLEHPAAVTTVPDILKAGAGRVQTLHFGATAYARALDLPPEQQRLDHPACDHARHLLQTATADTPVRISDGPSNLSPRDDGADEVTATWQTHATQVRHSLTHGYYQGWDLHPAHLPARYATLYDYHLTGAEEAIGKLRAWQASGTPATPAIQALTARLKRGVACGALDPSAL
ncbi:aldolase/citrate lyase family protein [Actinocorallia lasiicapitis]